VTIVDALRPYVKRPPRQHADDADAGRCDICGGPLAEHHAHVLRRDPRGVLCGCSPCAALFRDPAASGGRMRTVPDRVLSDARASVPDAQWAALGVPVGLAFFVVDSRTGQCTGHCPSPAGPVEIEIDPAAWDAIAVRLPLVRAMQADVEALLVHRPRSGDTTVLVAPIDACYALTGTVRMHWRGFDGGDEAKRAIDTAVAALRARSAPLTRAPAEGP